MTAGEISFGGLNLNDGTSYRTRGPLIIPGSGPELMNKSLANREGDIVVDMRYPSKRIPLSGSIHGGSPATLENNLDALVKTLNNGRQIFKPGWQDERYYLAELNSGLKIARAPLNRFFMYEAELLLADPFAYAPSVSTVGPDGAASTNLAGTHYSKTLTATPGGNMSTPLIFTLEVLTLAGTQAIWLLCPDIPGTPTLVITRTWSVLDILVVNTAEQSVQVNGVEVDYTGAFPMLDPRASATNSIEIHSISTSTPTFNAGFNWTKRYSAA